MPTRTRGTKPRKSRKAKPNVDDNGEEPEDYTKFGGFLMAVLGAIFGYSLVNSPWDYINAIPKVIGIIFCLFIVFGGVLLLLPEQDRPALTDALVKGFTLTLKAIVSMGKDLAKQISLWRGRRRERKEKEGENDSPASEQ
jgi:hypothetical protein